MLAIILLSGPQNLFSGSLRYSAHFNRTDGLMTGARVILNGVPVGAVESVNFDKQQGNVKVWFSVSKDAREWLRQGSKVEIATLGVLGDKYLSIDAGPENLPILPPSSDIPNRPSSDFSVVLSQSDRLLVSLNQVTQTLSRVLKSFEENNRSEVFFKGIAATADHLSKTTEKLNNELDQIKLKKAINNLNSILEKINNGNGTIGALINDPGLYDDLKALLGGANRNRIIRNLVRQTIKDSGKTQEAKEKAP